MANVVITGGAGFLGSRLARRPAGRGLDRRGGHRGPAAGPGDASRPGPGARRIWRLTRGCGGPRATSPAWSAPGQAGREALAGASVVFHLAAAVSGECEADFDLGMRANLHATEALLAACRAAGSHHPFVVYSSSIAVFGGSAEQPLPAVVDDGTLPNPQTSYGIQKFIGEQLVADYTRKGFLRGRSIRLMTVSVRPGRPNAAASGFMSGIIREPLAGQRAVCPVDPAAEVALAAPARAIEALRCAATSPDDVWGGRTAVTMPGLTVTVGDMVAALEQVAGPAVTSLIDWVPDPVVAGMVSGWAARFHSGRAARLGLAADPDFTSIIRLHLAEGRR